LAEEALDIRRVGVVSYSMGKQATANKHRRRRRPRRRHEGNVHNRFHGESHVNAA